MAGEASAVRTTGLESHRVIAEVVRAVRAVRGRSRSRAGALLLAANCNATLGVLAGRAMPRLGSRHRHAGAHPGAWED